MKKTNVNTKNIIVNYGIILGGILVFTSLIQYATGTHLEPEKSIGIISFLLIIAVIVMGVKKFKSENNNSISFGEAVKIGVGISILSALITVIYNLIFVNFIEPDFIDQLDLKQEEMMYNSGMSDEQIEKTIEIGKKFKGPFISSAIGIIASAFLGFVISAITGAIIKTPQIKE